MFKLELLIKLIISLEVHIKGIEFESVFIDLKLSLLRMIVIER